MLKNNRGFAVTAMVYGMMTIASLIMFLTLDVMSSNKNISREFADDVEDELNKCSYYQGTCYDWHEEHGRSYMVVSDAKKELLYTNSRSYTKSRGGSAIVALVKYTGGDGRTYLGPLLVGTAKENVYFRTTYDNLECTGNVNSFVYKGVTYYYSSNYNYMEDRGGLTWNSDYLVINDIMNGGESYPWIGGQEQAARDLLDYYYSW